MEEATQLLRRAPLAAVAAYCTGSFPFALGLLFFWAEMSRSSQAESRLLDASFCLALLYVWMKWWQAIFAARLRRVLTDQPALGALYPGELLRQGALHSWSFLVLPVALLITIPFGWCFAFFQNVTVLGGEEANLRALFRRAARQAALWPGQNHVLIFLLFLCWLFAFANLSIVAFLIPRLLKSLLGIDTLLVRSNMHLLNSTFFFAMAALTWLCLDPLFKAVYLLRCYYGESLETGVDLLRSFHRVKGAGRAVLPLLLAACLLSPLGAASAQGGQFYTVAGPAQGAQLSGSAASAVGTQPSGSAAPALGAQLAGGAGPRFAAAPLDAKRLEQSIARTLRDPEFSWRLPRKTPEKSPNGEHSLVRETLERIGKWLSKGMKWIFSALGDILEMLMRHAPKEQPASVATPFGDRVFLVMYGVLGLIVAWGIVLLRRRYLSGRRNQSEANAGAAPETFDLSDESLTAAELPSEIWKKLSDELFAKGERRLGLRALYLAAIAHLAAENYLSLARSKSNREYEREVKRRAQSIPMVADSFSENLQIFERVWYGLYDLRQEMVERFVENYGRIVTHARRG